MTLFGCRMGETWVTYGKRLKNELQPATHGQSFAFFIFIKSVTHRCSLSQKLPSLIGSSTRCVLACFSAFPAFPILYHFDQFDTPLWLWHVGSVRHFDTRSQWPWQSQKFRHSIIWKGPNREVLHLIVWAEGHTGQNLQKQAKNICF